MPAIQAVRPATNLRVTRSFLDRLDRTSHRSRIDVLGIDADSALEDEDILNEQGFEGNKTNRI